MNGGCSFRKKWDLFPQPLNPKFVVCFFAVRWHNRENFKNDFGERITMKKRILITGKVHDVGYRPFLLGLAESLEIERFFADNIFVNSKQVVEILIDGSEDKVSAFIELVKRKTPENADVEEIDIGDYDGNVMKTESYYRYLTAMQLAKIATYGGKMLDKQDSMLEKQDTMLGKMDSMLEKQDTMLGKMDSMLEKQDETVKVIKEESEKTREVLKSEIRLASSKIDKTNELLEKRFEKLEEEIEKIKRALIKAGIEIP
jgi:acylphosphatase